MRGETCSCSEVRIDGVGQGAFNWNPDCYQHGLDSAWWKSPEQVLKRQNDSQRHRVLQTKDRHARRLDVGCRARPAESLDPVGECPVCDATREELGLHE
jgi:hypothetical protein